LFFTFQFKLTYIACDDERVYDANAHAFDDNACLTPRGVIELEEAKKLAIVVLDEVECNEYVVHMSKLTDLQSKYINLLDENVELKSRSGLLGACKSSLGLQSELAEKNARSLLLRRPVQIAQMLLSVHVVRA
jgi:hypothetical protein